MSKDTEMVLATILEVLDATFLIASMLDRYMTNKEQSSGIAQQVIDARMKLLSGEITEDQFRDIVSSMTMDMRERRRASFAALPKPTE